MLDKVITGIANKPLVKKWANSADEPVKRMVNGSPVSITDSKGRILTRYARIQKTLPAMVASWIYLVQIFLTLKSKDIPEEKKPRLQ